MLLDCRVTHVMCADTSSSNDAYAAATAGFVSPDVFQLHLALPFDAMPSYTASEIAAAVAILDDAVDAGISVGRWRWPWEVRKRRGPTPRPRRPAGRLSEPRRQAPEESPSARLRSPSRRYRTTSTRRSPIRNASVASPPGASLKAMMFPVDRLAPLLVTPDPAGSKHGCAGRRHLLAGLVHAQQKNSWYPGPQGGRLLYGHSEGPVTPVNFVPEPTHNATAAAAAVWSSSKRRRPVGSQWALTRRAAGRTQRSTASWRRAFGATAALPDWLPDFRRVPSKANVSDAISRGDL